ncbi:MAG TPA: hypothetical protein DEW10_03320 [Bifidobacterium sp.]|nr:hypothetical protein [Bifidobacterium sp.]HCA73764.1 hypothetical protein [Bifidobacterium sp.]HCH21812.1 hypothetical protein [Bifidobacterium sp.]
MICRMTCELHASHAMRFSYAGLRPAYLKRDAKGRSLSCGTAECVTEMRFRRKESAYMRASPYRDARLMIRVDSVSAQSAR